MLLRLTPLFSLLCLGLLGLGDAPPLPPAPSLPLPDQAHLALVGGNLGARMLFYDHFETELHLRYPEKQLTVRNFCDPGDTPGFRPHPGRPDPWAFPGAEKFQNEYAKKTGSEGRFPAPDEWLSRHKTDVLLAFFGYAESFQGPEGVETFQQELRAWVEHSLQQRYNGSSAPQLVLISPLAFEDLSQQADLPNGQTENRNLALYAQAIQAVASRYRLPYVDLFAASQRWYVTTAEPLTQDGFQLNDAGYARLGEFLCDEIFGRTAPARPEYRKLVHQAVAEKNWLWHQDYKIPNGVHVFGRRYEPFGPDNYPAELEKIRQMTAIRDQAIWLAARSGQAMDVVAADRQTRSLPPVVSNFKPEDPGRLRYLYGEEALRSFKLAPGYRLDLFASEKEFPDLANPVQLSFDNQGRLWVATMPSYPHYRPGDPQPDDKILILEDTNQDGRADRQIIFARGLHLPLGFEFAPDGVYVSQGLHLKRYRDTDGDDQADQVEMVLSGFDDHDTHHNSSAFCADPSGAIYTAEGVFLHTNVETPHGVVRATNGGFYRYSPQRRELLRIAQVSIPNPWGIAFDDWGQSFYAETSSPDVRWMLPGTGLPRYGEANPKGLQLIEKDHMVRPTAGLEFVSSSHFPPEVQGDLLINNTIGFLGTKQHQVEEASTGYRTRHRQDLLVSTDPNFRPVDLEFAPDGSLYVVDWHNILIGHMQHNARDPLRDHVHGRIYRITYPARPLVKPAQIAGATIPTLLDNLLLPEYRTRYRTRRELRGRPAAEVLPQLTQWLSRLNAQDPRYEHHQLEVLWVSWGLNRVDQTLLRKLLTQAQDPRVRAAAVEVLRFNGHQIKDQAALLMLAVQDPHPRVRLAAVVAASWLKKDLGLPILQKAQEFPVDEEWMRPTLTTALAHLQGRAVVAPQESQPSSSNDPAAALLAKGKAIYSREGYCITCHQADGRGLPASGFPPLAGTPWVTGSPERLVKLLLHGLMGPITVNGQDYAGLVPMTPFGRLLNDEEIAAVASYIRQSFGNRASPIPPAQVSQIRAATAGKQDFYQSKKLLKAHPLEGK